MQSGQELPSGRESSVKRYELPSLEELIGIDLENDYPGKKNPQRQAFIKLYKNLVAKTADTAETERQQILAGALLFEYLGIVTSYSSEEAAKYQPGYLYNSGSRMHDLLRKKLNFDNGRLSSYEQIILLSKFYNFVKTTMSDDLADGVHWKYKQQLLDAIKPLLKLLLQNQHKTIEEILSARPPLADMIAKSEKATKEYEKKGSHAYSYFQDPKRPLQLMLIKFVNDSCREVYGNDVDDSEQQYDIRMGLYYYLGKQSNRGTLHDMCKNIMNKTTLTTIKKEEYNAWQAQLLQHLEYVKTNHADFLKNWQTENPKRKEFAIFLDQVQSDLLKNSMDAKVKELDPSKDNVHAISRTAARYGVDFAYSTAAQSALEFLGVTTMDAGAGAVGFVLGGPVGALIAAQLSALIRNKVIPDGAKYYFCGNFLNSVSDTIGDVTGEATATVYKYTLQTPVEGMGSLIKSLLEIYQSVEKPEVLEDKAALIEALMSLPDDVFSEKQKEVMVYTHQFGKVPEQTVIELDDTEEYKSVMQGP